MRLRRSQLLAHPFCDEEHDKRDDEGRDPEEPHLPLVAESDADEDAVGRSGDEDDRHPTEEGRPERRSPRLIAGSVEKVVATAVADDPAFEEGPRVERGEDDPGEEHTAEE